VIRPEKEESAENSVLLTIEYHEKDLIIAKEIGVRDGEGRAYGNLGNACQ